MDILIYFFLSRISQRGNESHMGQNRYEVMDSVES